MKFDQCLADKLVVKRSRDKSMARSLHSLVEVRMDNVQNIVNPTLKAEAYYEVVKELLTALLGLHGYKSYSHECLISFVAENYAKDLTQADIALMDQLRVIRNDIAYRGVFVEEEYLERNEPKIKDIVSRLSRIVKSKID